MKYIHHPLICPESLEERTYQLSIVLRALDSNTMVVLPTGLGKTAVALLTVASRVKNAGGKVLMLAPTKPLVEQHLRFFEERFIDPGDDGTSGSGCVMFTGETRSDLREKAWTEARLIFATPQVIKNDCLAGRYSLKDVSLLIVDECHRAVGNYAYVFLAGMYQKEAKYPLILAMTASPGGKEEKVMEVCENLGIGVVESRTENDPDVRPYIHERIISYAEVELPQELKEAVGSLKKLVQSRLDHLNRLGFTVPGSERLTQKAINGLQAQIQGRIRKQDPSAFSAASLVAEIMKLRHAISLGESQGSIALTGYLFKLSAEGNSGSGTKASKRLAHDPVFLSLLDMTEGWDEEIHPKPEMVIEIVQKQLEDHPESRVIVFATFRDTVQLMVERFKERGIDARRFVGQAKRDSEKGLSQKEQIETLRLFREGDFHVLISTSVGEEGLDVPSTDMVIFYEAVPSEIRSIQRKGRTGRHGSGKIVVLVTKGTADETFRWVSRSREKAMNDEIRHMSALTAPAKADPLPPAAGQTSISAFVDSDSGSTDEKIIVDDRELASRVAEHLHSIGASIEIRRLEYGDYAVGSRVLVERKTTRDFVDTLVERDLMGQLRSMADAVPRPVLIIEGHDLYAQRNINSNAIRGALAAITVDMGISILYTDSPEETAEMLYVIRRREDGEPEEHTRHHHKTYRTGAETQEYIISAFPGIGLKHARLLLNHFGSLLGVMNADKDELKEIPGIGEKMATGISDFSRMIYQGKY